MNRILIISLAGIGDTLMATPIIHEVRAQFPEATLEALVMWPGSRSLLGRNPHLDDVHQHHFLRSSRWASWRFVSRLRRRRFDVSLNLHPQGRREYRWIARLLGAKIRLSHTYENETKFDRWLVTKTLPQDYSVHCVENNLRLLGLLGIEPQLAQHPYELFLSPQEQVVADEFMKRRGLESRRLLGVHVGSGGTKNLALRRWPVERYVAVFRQLLSTLSEVNIVLFGGPDETEAHQELQRAISDPRLLVPATGSLREAAALLGKCFAFLSVDTVFMHLAAAMQVPHQLVIQTPTLNPPVFPRRDTWIQIPNPAIGERYLDWYRYDGRPIAGSPVEIRKAMEGVTVDAVLEPLQRVLSEK